ncbi:sister chromatid cohesion protein PDS5 homolog B isoform X1 [Lampetra fluviatilis]
MAQAKGPSNDRKIVYPPGVKEITDKISKEEIVRRLKMVVKTFMDMDQDSEEEKEQYMPLALHLASDFFLKHSDKDVRLLVACCLADIFRVYAPEAPYTSPDKIKDIFMFITRQLKGLEDTKSAQFNRYFYLLENLAWVKSYNICFELEESNDIFTQLYRTLFSVINNGHNQKVHMHMLDLMSSIITEGDSVSQELLDAILVNLVPSHKNLNKQAYELSKALLKRTAQSIEPYITNFFNQVLMLGKTSVSDLSEHLFDLILELYNIDAHLLLSVLPQLEFKLKSNDNEERLAVVKLLAKMFGAKDSELAAQNKALWQCFLGRFNDIHVPVRLECVKFASHCLMNHPDLTKDLTEILKVRSHDPEEAIRHDVIVSIVTASKKDLSLVNDQLLGYVRERMLDKRWRVRREAMMGLALIYKKYSLHAEAGKESAAQIDWIKDKLLHIYYQNSIDDKLLVERIFAQYLVPHNLETEERMKCLYYLYATLDPNAVKALNEMWKCQTMLRNHVRDLLELHKQPPSEATSKVMFSKVMILAKHLPDPGKAQDFMKKFNQVLEEDERISGQLEVLVDNACSCKQAELCVREITKKLANPKQPTNPFLEMVKFLLERIAPVHIDAEAVSALIKQINKSIEGTADDEDEGISSDTAIRAGLELLKVLSFTNPAVFHSAETFESLLHCLKMEDEKVSEAALQIFRNTGHKIETDFPQIRSALIPVLQQKAKKGTAQQAKHSIHCIFTIFSNRDTQFAQIFEPLSKSLDANNPEQLTTPLVSIGHMAMLAPEQFAGPMKAMVANFIVKDLLMNDRFPGKKMTKLWTPDEEVSPETNAKIQAIKLMVRWLLGMRNNQSKSGTSTLRLLSALIHSDGDLTEQGKISKSDMSRLRLAAGCAMLKLAQEPCYHEIITLEQYQLCALVINDECFQVRQVFAQKLHKALTKLRLPLEYVAVFSLTAKDPVKERRAHARQCLVKNITLRREYLKQHATVGDKLLSLLPEYMVPYTIHLLAHDPDFTKVQDVEQLKDIRECLWFILEVLMTKDENNSHAYIRKMVENIKQAKDAQGPDDPKMNEKMYTVCDIALHIITNKSTTYSLESPKNPVLPTKFFTQPDKNFNNTKCYLPEEVKALFSPGKAKAPTVLGTVNKPLATAGKQAQTKSSRMETMSNDSSNSAPSSPGRGKPRTRMGSESSEIDHSENDDSIAGKPSGPATKKPERRKDEAEVAKAEAEKVKGRKKSVQPEVAGGSGSSSGDTSVVRDESQVDSDASSPALQQTKQNRRGKKRGEDDEDESQQGASAAGKKAARGRGGRTAAAATATPPTEETAKPGKRGRKKAANGSDADSSPAPPKGNKRSKAMKKDEEDEADSHESAEEASNTKRRNVSKKITKNTPSDKEQFVLGSEGESMQESQSSSLETNDVEKSSHTEDTSVEPEAMEAEDDEDADEEATETLKVKRKPSNKRSRR